MIVLTRKAGTAGTKDVTAIEKGEGYYLRLIFPLLPPASLLFPS